MDLKTTSKYYQAPPSSATPLEYSKKNKGENPFDDTLVDPLCKLNLKETSDFVKSFQMKRDGSVSSVQGNNRRLIDAPPTPGRPVFSFSSSTGNHHHSRKGFPSKWDNAEKWIVNTTHDSPAHPFVKPSPVFQQKSEIFTEKSVSVKSFDQPPISTVPVSAFHGGGGAAAATEVLLKDKFTNNIEPAAIFPNFRYSEPSKEGFLFRNSTCESMKDAGTEMVPQIQHRDVGTEMTPLASSTTSRCHTPFKVASPARHNTPQDRSGLLATPKRTSTNIDISEHHFAKLEMGNQFDSVTSKWSSREEEEEEISKSLRHFDSTFNGGGSRKHNSAIEVKAASWEEEERTKCCSRYQREEAKIQAWVNLQSAKAEAQSKKLEVKIQRMRSNLEEKIMKRMAIVHRKAEELRSEAQIQHSQQVQKATEQAQKMILKNQQQQNSYYISDHTTSCGCFPCNNSHF
ncbi:hypothetical protein C5167_027660 [Papaver somniferum]|uniref:uncharacterized protein LOC113340281 n=1 Tax=Papaver somniferum TaxID=3469 RepID=UPI000E6F660F|nr:uncharacterized protein LOC113340281 [Papaver somniferum]RZC91593.1 hypothetical protein C5167_027660 [Papaver somniferum]